MTVLTEDLARTGAYLISEANGYRSRGAGVVASGAGVVKPGTVMGRVAADGSYVPLDPAAADGSEVAAAILFEGCDATSADIRRTLTVRDAEVTAAELIWPAGISAGDQTTATGQLETLGIVQR